VKRLAAAAGVALLGGLAAWSGVSAIQAGNDQAPVLPLRNAGPPPASGSAKAAPSAKGAPAGDATFNRVETPMADRVAVIGLLNKRNGVSRDLTLKPGQSVRVGDIVVRLRACEASAPWEAERLTGAFVQVDTQGTDQRWRRIFSGWLYKESPSLNVVEHPIYDIWPKSCAMKFPDMGPDTLVASAVAGGASKSSAKKSPADKPAGKAPAATVPSDNASSSSTR
jgi:hypothetical protein